MRHLSEPSSNMEMNKKKGPMKVKRVEIRCLDDGAYVVNVNIEDGNGHYESKEYAYEDKEELADDIVNDFLKGGKSSKKEGYLA